VREESLGTEVNAALERLQALESRSSTLSEQQTATRAPERESTHLAQTDSRLSDAIRTQESAIAELDERTQAMGSEMQAMDDALQSLDGRLSAVAPTPVSVRTASFTARPGSPNSRPTTTSSGWPTSPTRRACTRSPSAGVIT